MRNKEGIVESVIPIGIGDVVAKACPIFTCNCCTLQSQADVPQSQLLTSSLPLLSPSSTSLPGEGLHVFAVLVDSVVTFNIGLVAAPFGLTTVDFGFGFVFGFTCTKAFGFPLLFATVAVGLACGLVGAASLAFGFGLVFSLVVEDHYIFTNFNRFQQRFILRSVHYYVFIVCI
ncbi:hypothetical protein BHE74_00030176 [Ensete ventricosum]|nr:hypothetical protein BHE74_00030176 [Ensete ventricosum]